MAKFCIKCGRAIRPGDSFCLGCGQPVGAAGTPTGGLGGAAPEPPASYVAFDSAPLASFERDTESDMAATEVWQVPSNRSTGGAVGEMPDFSRQEPMAVPQFDSIDDLPVVRGLASSDNGVSASSDSVAFESSNPESDVVAPLDPFVADDDDEYDESPTIVVQPIAEDDEEESPTIVVARERYVLVRDSDGQRTELLLPCILGRGKAADKRVKGNLAISRKHAKVFREDELIMIQDQQSTNGTFVNGSELDGDQSVPLADGDAIRLGTEDFTFHIESV